MGSGQWLAFSTWHLALSVWYLVLDDQCSMRLWENSKSRPPLKGLGDILIVALLKRRPDTNRSHTNPPDANWKFFRGLRRRGFG